MCHERGYRVYRLGEEAPSGQRRLVVTQLAHRDVAIVAGRRATRRWTALASMLVSRCIPRIDEPLLLPSPTSVIPCRVVPRGHVSAPRISLIVVAFRSLSCPCPLNADYARSKGLSMQLPKGILGSTPILVLDKGVQRARNRALPRSRNVATNNPAKPAHHQQVM